MGFARIAAEIPAVYFRNFRREWEWLDIMFYMYKQILDSDYRRRIWGLTNAVTRNLKID